MSQIPSQSVGMSPRFAGRVTRVVQESERKTRSLETANYGKAALPPAESGGDFFQVRVKVQGTDAHGNPMYLLYDKDVDVFGDLTGIVPLNAPDPGDPGAYITLSPICSRARWSQEVVSAGPPSPVTDPATAGVINLASATYVGTELVLWDLPEFLGATTDPDCGGA